MGSFKPEGHWSLREMFIDGSVKKPAYDGIVGRMAGPRYTSKATARQQVENKDELRRRGISSPDKSDAPMLSLLPNKRKVKLWS